MNLAALAPGWLVALLFLLLIAAAVEDAWRMEIANSISLAVATGAALAVLVVGAEVAVWQNVALLLIVLAIGTLLFAKGMMGGGDVKLLAASALWFDLAGGLKMLVAVAVAGGLEVVLLAMIRRLPFSSAARERIALLRATNEIPYGIAIAFGVGIATCLAR